MKLTLLPDARFTCQCCAKCCRGWHVELLAGEGERIEKLEWPVGDPLERTPAMFEHAGKVYLPHQADGSCVFLNATNGLCRIHERFGLETKPLGCQLYPFRISPTFKGQASVSFRYDCPAVRRNDGAPMAESLSELKRFSQQLVLPAAFDEHVIEPFNRQQIEAVCEFVSTLLNGFERNDERALFIIAVSDWLGEVKPEHLDREMLARSFVELKQRLQSGLAVSQGRPGIIQRIAFRTLLGIYLRRDEDILNGHASRLRRLMAMLSLVLGYGDFSGLGVLHPKGSVRRAGLFTSRISAPSVATGAVHWQMIRAKLESFQFMGSANPGHGFLPALKSLALTYPLVLAAAKYRAGNRGAAAVEESDIDYAVGVIEHSYGRGAMLQLPFARSLETFLLEPSVFQRLVQTM